MKKETLCSARLCASLAIAILATSGCRPAEFRPVFLTPEDGVTIRRAQRIDFEVSVESLNAQEFTVDKVDFILNGAIVGTDESPPYTWAWDVDHTSNGSQQWAAAAHVRPSSQPERVVLAFSDSVEVRVAIVTRLIGGNPPLPPAPPPAPEPPPGEPGTVLSSGWDNFTGAVPSETEQAIRDASNSTLADAPWDEDDCFTGGAKHCRVVSGPQCVFGNCLEIDIGEGVHDPHVEMRDFPLTATAERSCGRVYIYVDDHPGQWARGHYFQDSGSSDSDGTQNVYMGINGRNSDGVQRATKFGLYFGEIGIHQDLGFDDGGSNMDCMTPNMFDTRRLYRVEWCTDWDTHDNRAAPAVHRIRVHDDRGTLITESPGDTTSDGLFNCDDGLTAREHWARGDRLIWDGDAHSLDHGNNDNDGRLNPKQVAFWLDEVSWGTDWQGACQKTGCF